jgi:hypothetical protein
MLKKFIKFLMKVPLPEVQISLAMDCILLYVCYRRCVSRANAKRFTIESETVISQKTDVFVDESTPSDDELIFQFSSSRR